MKIQASAAEWNWSWDLQPAYFCVQSGIGAHLEKFLPLELTGAYSFPGAEITIS